MIRFILTACLMTAAMHTGAAEPAAANGLRAALESAWARHPLAASAAARSAQWEAQRNAADSWLADAPTFSLSQKTDRWQRNAGARETEAELALPLTLPGQRNARMAAASMEGTQWAAHLAAEKLRLAGEVREAWWAAHLADSDSQLARRKAADARGLADEVRRRFAAGDVARTDWNQAESAARQAESAEALAAAAALRSQRIFAALTGLPLPAMSSVEPEPSAPPSGSGKPDPDAHPLLLAAQREVDLARARRDAASADRSDPPVLSFGTVQEKAAAGEASTGSAVLRISIPLPTRNRNAPRIAAATAELSEAETRLARVQASLIAERETAIAELEAHSTQQRLQERRASLARENQQLLARAWRLGEIDLATRLRSEAEHFDAELSLTRARLETARAQSRLHQATGLLP